MVRISKPKDQTKKIWFLGWVFVLVIITLRIAFLYTTELNLFFDEAQYWDWAKNLDWGYYSKPPVVAWMIFFSTSLCGSDSEFCIRIGSPFLHLGTSIILYFLGSLLYSRNIGVLSAITYLLLPSVSLSSFLISTDPPLLFFWALLMLAFLKASNLNHNATKQGREKDSQLKQKIWWIIAGFSAGFGMLSKYNMVMALPSVLVICLWMPYYRACFTKPCFWLSIGIAILLFSPNIFWNISNDFASFMHTKHNANLENAGFSLSELGEFLSAQFGVFGPFMFATLLLFLVNKLRKPSSLGDSERFLLAFILPLLIVIIIQSFISRAHANWAAPIYVPATILVVAFLYESISGKVVLMLSTVLHVFLFLLIIGFTPLVSSLNITLTGNTTSLKERKIKDPLQRLKGWRELGERVKALHMQYPNHHILTTERKIHAELLYYTKIDNRSVVKWNEDGSLKDHYELTTTMSEDPTQPYLLITNRDIRDPIDYFDSVLRLEDIRIDLYFDKAVQYEIYKLNGFRGYHGKER